MSESQKAEKITLVGTPYYDLAGPLYDCPTYDTVNRAVLKIVNAARAEALREAADWIAESIGYPVETKMPDHPMPQPLWDALVNHIHADEVGKWHGNALDREETESWLADEAGRSHHPTSDRPA